MSPETLRHSARGASVTFVLLVAVLIMILPIVSGCSDGATETSGTGTEAPASSTDTSASTTTTEVPPVQGKVGDEVEVAGWLLKVDSVEGVEGIDGVTPGEDQELLVVHFTVRNEVNRPRAVVPDELAVRGAESGYHPATTEGVFAMSAVEAGGQATSYVAFKVKKGETKLELVFTPFFEGAGAASEARVTLR